MPTVFASVCATIVFFYLTTLLMAHLHWMSVGAHMLWGCFTALLVIFLQCMVFGFFINSGKSIKKVVKERGLSGRWIEKTKDYKNRSYPMLMLAILVSLAAAVLGGGVSVGALPVWVHAAAVWGALGVNAYSFWISYKVIVENVEAIHQINREVDADPAPVPKITEVPVPSVPRPPAPPSATYYFLAVVVWVPYLYIKFSLGSRTFPFLPFLAASLLLLAVALWKSRKT
ncbi:MAG TPA: hypothetical protein VHE12_01295 [bacterium]|nr:hypothetical protein [bacterium]